MAGKKDGGHWPSRRKRSGYPRIQAETEARLRVARIVQMSGAAAGEKALVAGETEGMLANRLVEAGAEVTWLEPVSGNRRRGRSPLAGEGITRIIGKLEDLPFEDEAFDLAVSQGFGNAANPARAASEMLRVLKPGGTFVVAVSNSLYGKRRGLPCEPGAFAPGELENLLAPLGLEEMEIGTLIPDLRFPALYRRDLSFCQYLEKLPYLGKRGRLLFLKGVKASGGHG
jgi:SAM-dependent methyltransferase